MSFRQDAVRAVSEGAPVEVRRDEANEFDANACMVVAPSGHVGFVPAGLAARLCERSVGRWSGVVTEVLYGESRGLRVRIEADLADGAPSPLDAAPRPATEVAAPSNDIDAPPLDEIDAAHADGPAAPDGPSEPATLVRARSGRVLGEMVRTDGDKVVVRSGSGVEIPYPSELVTV